MEERMTHGALSADQGESPNVEGTADGEGGARTPGPADGPTPDMLLAMHEAIMELSRSVEIDDICRRAVELGRDVLGIDRVGIWFRDEVEGWMRGTFGTDELGNTRDERASRVECVPQGPVHRVLDHRSRFALKVADDLRDDHGQVVGRGHGGVAALWDGAEVAGCVLYDNLLTRRLYTNGDHEVMALYASAIGHLIARKRAERELTNRATHLLLLSTATALAHEAEEPSQALQGVLEAVCSHTGWPIGAALLRAQAPEPQLVATDIWHVDDAERWQEFAAEWGARRWGPGDGVEGAVLATGLPQWQNLDVPNTADSPELSYYRRRAAEQGLRTAVACPVKLADEVVAVLVFGSYDALERDPGFEQVICDIGVQVGRVFERAQAGQALAESEEQYRSLVDNTSVGVFRSTPTAPGRVVRANRAAASMFGYDSVEELLAVRPVDLYANPDDRATSIRGTWRDGWARSELPMKRKDGSVFWAAINARVSTDASGALLWLDGVVEDVTAQRAHAEQQQRWTRGLRAIVEVTHELLTAKDPDTVYRRAVELAREHLCLERCSLYLCEGSQFVGTYGTDAEGNTVPEHDCHFESSGLRRPRTLAALSEKPWVEGNVTHTWWDSGAGGRVEIGSGWVATTPIRNSRGIVGCFFNDAAISGAPPDPLAQDLLAVYGATLGSVIERLRDEEERQQLQARLERTQRVESLGVLAGGIAHDFNNILAAIVGYTELALTDLPEGDARRSHLTHVLTAAQRARDLVRQILTFGRQSEAERKPLDLAPALEEALRFVRASLPATIKIRHRISHSCGAVLADGTQIHQVLTNLCTNAEHAMRDTGGILEITLEEVALGDDVGTRPEPLVAGAYACLSVADTGCGMEPAVAERIFEPFYTTKPAGEGTGLGLSVVHGIVSAHGGGIRVDSEPGTGSRFRVFLPVLAAEHVAERVAQPALVGGTERILVVEDDPALATLATQMLEALGYSVAVFGRPGDALAAFAEDPAAFDLVLTDHTMPELTGIQVAERARIASPDVPIIIMAGFSQRVDEAMAARLGVCEILAKPYGLASLAAALRRALDAPGN